MSRPVLFISAGTAALLVALFVLWQSTRSNGSEPIAPPRVASEPVAPAVAPSAPAIPASPAPTRAARPPAAPAPTPQRTTATPSPPPPPAVPPADAPTGGTNLHFGATQLKAQTKAVEPLVRECVDKATSAGMRPSGSATLTYHVVKHDDKYEIEDTGIDYGKTSLEGDALLECLHQTAKGMKFEGLPNNLTGISAARRVTLENGEITEYAHVTFRSLR